MEYCRRLHVRPTATVPRRRNLCRKVVAQLRSLARGCIWRAWQRRRRSRVKHTPQRWPGADRSQRAIRTETHVRMRGPRRRAAHLHPILNTRHARSRREVPRLTDSPLGNSFSRSLRIVISFANAGALFANQSTMTPTPSPQKTASASANRLVLLSTIGHVRLPPRMSPQLPICAKTSHCPGATSPHNGRSPPAQKERFSDRTCDTAGQ
jgi:hypothetical protein